jgi:AcrR family transcriptional regulator
MNQITLGGLEAATMHRPNQRALAKQRTREKILASAKALFAERGYEAATIRDIAKQAGMSTGAVFASFTDKSDLFTEIAETEQTELNAAMRAAAGELTGRAAVVAMLDVAADRHMGEIALFRAVMSALWTPRLAEKARRRLDRRPPTMLIAAALRADLGCADAHGPEGDAAFAIVAEMIWDGYVALVRRAALGALTPEALKARMREQVRTVLSGLRRK